MTIYKGTNIYQTAVEDVVSSFAEASDYFQLVITRKNEEDFMTIKLEPGPSVKESEFICLSENITKKIKRSSA